MSAAKEGWFTELSTMWPGQGLSLQIEEVLYKGKSEFQVRISLYFRTNLVLHIYRKLAPLSHAILTPAWLSDRW